MEPETLTVWPIDVVNISLNVTATWVAVVQAVPEAVVVPVLIVELRAEVAFPVPVDWAVPLVEIPGTVIVAQMEYEACMADATSTLNSPIPLLCCEIAESGLVGSSGGAEDCAQPCSNKPADVEVLNDDWEGSSKIRQRVHL